MRYEEIRDELQSGDVVLFSGKGDIPGAIKWMTRSKWSHVGLVLRSADIGAVLLWESTMLSDVPDVETGLPTLGVQVVPLSMRLAGYGGEVAVRQLNRALDPQRKKALSDLRRELRGRPYERRMGELFKSAWDGPFGANQHEDLSSLFCSELVAEAYQRMGLLPEDQPSNEYTPADWGQDRSRALLDGYALGGEKPLDA